jgi:hypothetical protein
MLCFVFTVELAGLARREGDGLSGSPERACATAKMVSLPRVLRRRNWRARLCWDNTRVRRNVRWHHCPHHRGETIYGTYGDDVIQAKDGNDTVYPVNGDDLACGGDGQDTIDESGYSGVDHLVGGYGGDFLYDNVNASTGGTLNGNSGGDVLEGTDGGNNLYGGPGDNFIYAEEGADNVYGGDDADVINASNGNDTVYAGDANDTVLDGYGSDFLRGEGGSGDILRRCDNLNDFAGFETVYGPNSAYC